jgi:hypothetical protein
MKAFKLLGLALVSAILSGATTVAADAAALPDLHIALGEAFPATSTGESKKASWAFLTPGGTVLTGTGMKLTTTWTGLDSMGTYVLNLSNAAKGVKKCKTSGDAAGTVLISGQVNIVFLSLAPLTVALLLTVPKTKAECEGLNVTLEGDALGSYNGSLNANITEYKTAFLCEKGQPVLKKYLDDSGTLVEAVLLSEAGAGFTKTCFEVGEELTLKANKMIEVLG